MGRILAIDYGTRRTGLAVTDPLRIIADVDIILLGKPSQMNGQPSETMRYIEPLAGRLRHAYPNKEVVLWDERFTSVMAHRTILESGIGKMARRDKALVDRISATIILQSYMDSAAMQK